jgi:hypothetical protein
VLDLEMLYCLQQLGKAHEWWLMCDPWLPCDKSVKLPRLLQASLASTCGPNLAQATCGPKLVQVIIWRSSGWVNTWLSE